MVEVITAPADKVATNANPTDFLSWIGHNIFTLIFVAIVIALAIAIYVIWKKWQDDLMKRDHPIYEAYCNAVSSSQLNANTKWIDKRYSLMNLLWFGLPLKWNEHSAKIRNRDDEVFGWYRGHYYAQDGYLHILLYKTKKMFIFENIFLIKCPVVITYKQKKTDNDGKFVRNEAGDPVIEKVKLNFAKYIQFQSNHDIKLICFALETYSYYSYPVYISEWNEPIDLRGYIGENVIETGQGQLVTRVFEEGSRMARKGMEHNPQVNAERMSPNKVKEDEQQ